MVLKKTSTWYLFLSVYPNNSGPKPIEKASTFTPDLWQQNNVQVHEKKLMELKL